MKYTKLQLKLGMLFISLLPVFSYAHPGHTESYNLFSGLVHPFSGLDHFLVILLVGFWSVLAFKKPATGPISFVLGMSIGAVAGLFLTTTSSLEFAISASVFTTGILLSTNRKFSEVLGLLLLTSFGIVHGLAHTVNLPVINGSDLNNTALDLLGLLFSTALLHFVGIFFAMKVDTANPIVRKLIGIPTYLYGIFLLVQLAMN